jgi:predicted  nucleic acid-binding Zn-ribbon protein
MPAPVPQGVWDERAAKVNIELLADVIDSNTKVAARCLTCGRTWDAIPRHLREGRGCQRCTARATASRKRLPQSVWQERAAKVSIEFLEDVLTSQTKTLARCTSCGNVWRVQPDNVSAGHGCPRCDITNPSVWDARIARVGAHWIDQPQNATTRCRAQCDTCGHVWLVRPADVNSGTGCPPCAASGFDPVAPARLYLLALADDVLKIGVTGVDSVRLDRHRGRGWEVVKIWQAPTGQAALDLEAAVVAWWRDQGAIFATRDEVPAGQGFTECVCVGVVDIPSTMVRVEELRAEPANDRGAATT